MKKQPSPPPKKNSFGRLTELMTRAGEQAQVAPTAETAPVPEAPVTGLLALVGEQSTTREAVKEAGKYRIFAIDDIDFDPLQPRQHIDQQALESLAESIRAQGVLQLPIVRPNPRAPGRYMVVIGERRIRAQRMCRYTEVECRYEEWNDTTARAAQLVENSEHARLNVHPWEEATAMGQLEQLLGSQKAIVDTTGLPYAHVTKRLAMLNLPEEIKELLRERVITDSEVAYTLGTLFGLDKARALELILKGRNAGRLERSWVRLAMKSIRMQTTKANNARASNSELFAEMQTRLKAHFEGFTRAGTVATKVAVGGKTGGVKIELKFKSDADAQAFLSGLK